MVIKATKRIFNSDKMCRSYSDLNLGVTFLEHSVYFCIYAVRTLMLRWQCRTSTGPNPILFSNYYNFFARETEEHCSRTLQLHFKTGQ